MQNITVQNYRLKGQKALKKISSLVSFNDPSNTTNVPRFKAFISRPLTSSRAKLNVFNEDGSHGMPLNSMHSTTINSASQLNTDRFFFNKPIVELVTDKKTKISSLNNLFLQWDKEDNDDPKIMIKTHLKITESTLPYMSPPRKSIPNSKRQSIKPVTSNQQPQTSQKIQAISQNQKRLLSYINVDSITRRGSSQRVSVRKLIPTKIVDKSSKNRQKEISSIQMQTYDQSDTYGQPVRQRDINFVNKKMQIDPYELKLMFEEIMAANNKIDMHVKDNIQFFSNLFDDGMFEPWLKVDKHILSQKELEFTVETFKLKQELVKNRINIDEVDFETLDSILSKLSFFERFTKSTRINILKLASYMTVQPGEYVFFQGDYGDNLYVILKGSITVKIDTQLGDKNQEPIKQIVSSLFDGQHFGELAMMETKQKDEQDVLEEKLQGINITSMQEVKQGLYSNNHKQKENDEDENVRSYIVEIANNDPSGQKAKSNISYKQASNSSQRQASIQASETCHLITIGRDNFQNILMVLMQDELESKIKMLRSLRFFQDVQPFVLIPLANQLIQNAYGLDHVVVREKEPLEQMFIIYKGSCNVIRQIVTQRQIIPTNTLKGSIKSLPKFVFGEQKLTLNERRMFPQGKISKFKKQDEPFDDNVIDKIGDNMVIMQDDNKVVYEQTYVYKRLQQGDIIFGRALTGYTLEGIKGQDHARMTIVSSSNNTILYSISKKLLAYCPDFLSNHLINYLITLQDTDVIQPQPINKDLKRLNQIFNQQENYSEAEKDLIKFDLKRQQQNPTNQTSNLVQIKQQNEGKQDIRNRDWENYKTKLNVQSIQQSGIDRTSDSFKRY